MKIIKIQNYLNEADKTIFGIDLIKLNLKQKVKSLSKILSEINFSNSNTSIKDINNYGVSFSKVYTQNGPALNVAISIDGIPYTIMQYLEYGEGTKKMLRSEGAITYYGTYFRLLEIGKLDYKFEIEFFNDELHILNSSSISRLDYKIDFCYKKPHHIIPMQDIIEYNIATKSRTHFLSSNEYQKHWDLMRNKLNNGKSIDYESLGYFNKGDFQTGWSVGSKTNKSVFIRCYEKLLDTIVKGKVKLYDDYFSFNNVFRLEFEFRTKFNKKSKDEPYTYGMLSELEYKIHRYLGLEEKEIGEKFLYQYESNGETDFIDRDKYQKDFGGRGMGLVLRATNPFIILFKFLLNKCRKDEQNNKHIKIGTKEFSIKTEKINRNKLVNLVEEFFDFFNNSQIKDD